jgi:hypothetical protein
MKGGIQMLALEIIGVLGALYGFFMLAMLKGQRAEKRMRDKVKTERSHLAQQKLA